MEITLIIN